MLLMALDQGLRALKIVINQIPIVKAFVLYKRIQFSQIITVRDGQVEISVSCWSFGIQ